MRKLLDRIHWVLLIVLCLTLGLAPFFPEPHLWEKLRMLFAGQLVEPIDIFDLLMHATPWLLLILKAVFAFGGGTPAGGEPET
ncbi:MAG: RND transporter [Gammaproteobacteria bacterium]|nr:RND transporter [Gammaproteobacteria bacterium]